MSPRSHSLIFRFRRALLWLWQQEGTPGQRARGFAVGVFCGCFPLFGLQTLLGIILASLCRGNRLLAAMGTWISNPITYVPLYWANYQIGCFLLGQSLNFEEVNELTVSSIWNQGWIFSNRLLVGCTFVGGILGLIAGLTIYSLLTNQFIIRKYREKHFN